MKRKYDFYPYREILSYNADGYFIIGSRDVGKTFGLREQFIRDYIRDGRRFVNVTRTKTLIPLVGADYFGRVVSRTRDSKIIEWMKEERISFETRGMRVTVANLSEKGKRCNVDTIGYIAPLAASQTTKQITYDNVQKFVLDEAIIEPEDKRTTRYQGDEWAKLNKLVDSASRERPEDSRKAQIFLLSNACDLVNPWFRELGISEMPEFGRRWYLDKTWLLDYVDPATFTGDYAGAKAAGTTAGRMMRHRGADYAATNAFKVDSEFISKRPRGCAYESGYIYHGHVYGFWVDYANGIGYICDEWLRNDNFPMYALTTEDNRVNYLAAKEADKALRYIVELYGRSILRFSSIGVKSRFLELLRAFGVR